MRFFKRFDFPNVIGAPFPIFCRSTRLAHKMMLLVVLLCAVIPEFQTSRMAKRDEQRCIGSRTARMMYNWAHFRFRQRLIHKAREYPRCRVIVVREDYTSKTCGCCGAINRQLGGAEVYRCRSPLCNYVAGRDASAARNILLRYLTEFASLDGIDRHLQQKPSSWEEGTFEPCLPRSRFLASCSGCWGVRPMTHVA